MSRRAKAWLAGALAGFALMPVVLTVRYGAAAVQVSDFTEQYTAATFVRQGQPAAVYDAARMGQAMLRTSGGRIDPNLDFDYPVAELGPFVPLTLLPLQAAFHVWQLLILILLATAVWLLNRKYPLGKSAVPWGLVAVLAAEPTWALFTEGQAGAMLVLGAVAVVAAARSDGMGWGFLGGLLLSIKPQYLPVYLVFLWGVGCRRALLAAVGGGLVVGLSALLAGGPAGMVGMAHAMLIHGATTELRSMDSWAALLALALPEWPASIAGLVLFAGTLTGFALLAARRRIDPLALLGLAGCIALLGSPHTLPHDVVLLLVPAWAAFELHRQGRLPSPIPGLAVLQVAWLADLHGLPVSAGALALTGVLAWYAYELRRRAAARPPLAVAA